MALRAELVAGQVDLGLAVAGALADQHIHGQIDQHRAGPAGRGDMRTPRERSARGLSNVLDDAVVLRDRAGDAGGVGLLERVVADQVGPDLAGEGDHRDRVHHGGGQAGDEVAGPGTAGGEDHAGLAAGAGVAVGHVAAALLVPRNDESDRGVVELVEQGQHDPSDVAEHRVDAEIDQSVDNDLSAGFHGLGCGSRGFWFRWHLVILS